MHEYYWPELAMEYEFTVLTHEYYWPEYHKLPWYMNITLKYAIKIITVATQSEDRQTDKEAMQINIYWSAIPTTYFTFPF